MIESSAIAVGVAVLMLILVLVLVVLAQFRRPPLMVATGFKAVLITGCDQGFGYMLAKRLDGAGYKIFAGCLDAEGEGAVTLQKEASPKLEVIQLDVTQDDQVEKARVTVVDSLEGRVLWAVVNNAGMASHVEFELTPKAHFRKMVDVNLIGLVNVTRAFLPLIRATRGRVINISSMAGRTGVPGFTAYSASKYGVVGFSECLRREMVHFGVKVILVEPFIYKTAMGTARNVVNQNDNFWEMADPGIRRDYGEYFFSQTQEARRTLMMGGAIKKLNEAIDCLEDAVSSPSPCLRYVPPWHMKFLNDLLSLLPFTIQDYILHRITLIRSKPYMVMPVENGGGPRAGRRRSHAL
ncbi:hypothetical protein RRG08_023432 [Elysia crispata]|uniref:Uncharacterized protein n=1 Tax=Elysia crispata TaxID=231223 RepID=A0AAE0YFS7_9GAST|nr:hypothetical protein RRG08_023432 [Elysia crispata]